MQKFVDLKIKSTLFIFLSLATWNNQNAGIISKMNSTLAVAGTFHSKNAKRVFIICEKTHFNIFWNKKYSLGSQFELQEYKKNLSVFIFVF